MTNATTGTHFLRLADRGAKPGASPAESNCHLLAGSILDSAPGLDARAIAGLKAWIDLCVAMPETARSLLP